MTGDSFFKDSEIVFEVYGVWGVVFREHFSILN